jgi:polysaccharide biosynthesis transport protein
MRAGSPAGVSEIRQILAVLRRRWRMVAAAGLICMLLGAALGKALPNTYKAAAKVLIGAPSARVANVEEIIGELPLSDQTIRNEVELFRSRLLAEQVVGRLELDRYPELNPALDDPDAGISIRDLVSMAKKSTKDLVARAAAAVGVPMAADDPVPSDRRPIDDVIDVVLRRLQVEPEGKAQVIEVAFEARDPSLAASIANTYAEQYLTDRVETWQSASADAGDWLQERLGTLREEVEANEAAVEQFRQTAGLFQGMSAPIKAESLSELTRELVTARAELSKARSRYQQAIAAADSGNAEALTDVLLSETIRDLRAEEAVLAAEVAELRGAYGPRHPLMLERARRLAGLRAELEAEKSRILQSLEGEVQAAAGRIDAIRDEIRRLEEQLRDQDASEARLRGLEREADASQEVFREFLIRATTAVGLSHGAGNDGRLISPAVVPKAPSSPSATLLALFGLVFGCFAGAAAAFGFEMYDDRFRSALDAESSLELPVIGVLPLLQSLPGGRKSANPEDYVASHPTGSFGEALRVLEHRLAHDGPGHRRTTAIVTSSLSGEGKTSVSLSLSRRAAMSGLRVLLVDADSRLGRVHQFFGTARSPGLGEFMRREKALAYVICFDPESGLHFMPCGTWQGQRSAHLTAPRLRMLLEQVLGAYDLIIIDTPPVLPVYDACALASEVDEIVLVVDWGMGDRDSAHAAALRLCASAGHNRIGVVLNKVDLRRVSSVGYPEVAVYGRCYDHYHAAEPQ